MTYIKNIIQIIKYFIQIINEIIHILINNFIQYDKQKYNK